MATSKGPLQTKLKPRRLPLLADTATQLNIVREWQDEDHAKLLLLCNEFGIKDSPDRFYRLALALALRRAGREYLLVEARDRIGGRIK